MDTVLLKCQNCGTINKIIVSKFALKPKCHNCKTVLEWAKKPVDAYSGSFQNEVIGHPGIVLVEFWSPTCGHCRVMSPLIDEFALEKNGIIKIVKINSMAEPGLASQFNIMGVPTFILFNNGNKLASIPGAMNKDQLVGWIRQYINI
jgi:thioredoxin 2